MELGKMESKIKFTMHVRRKVRPVREMKPETDAVLDRVEPMY